MPYLLLASSFDELDRLTAIVNQIEEHPLAGKDLPELLEVKREIERIKVTALRYQWLFGAQINHFISHNIAAVGALVIRIKEVNRGIQHPYLLTPEQDAQLKYYQCLDALFRELLNFFTDIPISHSL